MTPNPSPAGFRSTAADPVPPILATWLAPFQECFTAPVWRRVLVLVAGALPAPGQRTVSAALRVMGLAELPGFGRYHEVLSEARWDARALARRLLIHLLATLLPNGEVVIGIDDTIERRWGPQTTARGIYRDPVRSSRGFFVKASGLRWLSGRSVTVVGDTSFASLELIAAVRRHVRLITRLRLDASLFAPAPPPRPGRRGRRPLKGARLPKLTEVLANPATVWTKLEVTDRYGGDSRVLDIASGTAV